MSYWNYKVYRGTEVIYDSFQSAPAFSFLHGDCCLQTSKEYTWWYERMEIPDWHPVLPEDLPKPLRLLLFLSQ